ncbi:hypothetical protein D3C74_420120 [compost metagenome]
MWIRGEDTAGRRGFFLKYSCSPSFPLGFSLPEAVQSNRPQRNEYIKEKENQKTPFLVIEVQFLRTLPGIQAFQNDKQTQGADKRPAAAYPEGLLKALYRSKQKNRKFHVDGQYPVRNEENIQLLDKSSEMYDASG